MKIVSYEKAAPSPSRRVISSNASCNTTVGFDHMLLRDAGVGAAHPPIMS